MTGRRTARSAVLVLTALAGAALLAWTALGSWKVPPIGPHQDDYYNLLVRGFRKGSLALDLPVPEELKRMENPWDASKRPPNLSPHDVSYYRGHYYLYFGVVPAVLLFWPFALLTHCELPFVWSAVVFGVGAYLLSAWLWLRIIRDQFPRASLLTQWAGVACLGLVGGQLALERRVGMWEVPIEGGHFFMMVFLVAGYLALTARRPRHSLAAAGLALGLAIGCRPSLIAAGPALGALALVMGLRSIPTPAAGARRAAWLPAVAAAAFPLALVLAGLFAYNQARFGRWSEFGTTYQLSGGYDYRDRPFSPVFFPHDFYIYFWSRPQWGRYFPFLHPIAQTAQPKGYYGIEYVYGALWVCPVLWWIGPGLVAAVRRPRRTERWLFGGLVALVAVGTTLLLLCFNVAAARYEADFLPWWVWLALLGWAGLEEAFPPRGWAGSVGRWLARPLFGVVVAASLVLALCESAEVHGILRFSNPAAYARLARIFDTPVAWWERQTRFRGGPMEMTVVFPAQPSGSVEPLLVTGVEYQKDFVFVFYTDPRHLQIGYRSLDTAPIQSELLTVEPGRAYRLRIETGALYPPSGHPFYAGWTDFEIRGLTHWVKISVDGRTVIDQPASANEASPELIQVGRDKIAPFYGRKFTGVIKDVVRTGARRPQLEHSQAGDVRLDLSFSDEPSTGRQPMLVAGGTGHSDSIAVRRLDRGHFVFSEEIWGGGLWESGSIPIPPGRPAELRIHLGPAWAVPARSPLSLWRHSVVVWVNGALAWWRWTPGEVPPGAPVVIGENLIGSSAMERLFPGRLNASERVAAPTWQAGGFVAVSLRLGGRGRGTEPLLLTGRPGQDDLLEMEWLPGGKARLSYCHGRKLWINSPIFSWGQNEIHRLRIAAPALPTLDSKPGAADGPLTIDLDGRTVWRTQAPFYVASSDSVVLGGGGLPTLEQPSVLTAAVVDISQEVK